MVMSADIGDGEASTQDLANDAIQLNAPIMQTTVQIPQSETRSGFANFGPEENLWVEDLTEVTHLYESSIASQAVIDRLFKPSTGIPRHRV